MTTLVVGDDLLLLFGHHPGLALGTGHDAFDGLLQQFVGDGRVARPGRHQGPLVDHLGQVRTGHPGGLSGEVVDVEAVGPGFALGADLEAVAAPVDVGAVDDDLPVEAAGTLQCRVEDVGAVGGGAEAHTALDVETVHLDQHLVEGLFPFVVSAAHTGSAVTTHRVDLVDEDDRGGVGDRKSTRLNSSHVSNSYAVFCWKKTNLTHTI